VRDQEREMSSGSENEFEEDSYEDDFDDMTDVVFKTQYENKIMKQNQ
jgi:hypothetical protein